MLLALKSDNLFRVFLVSQIKYIYYTRLLISTAVISRIHL